MDSGALLNRRDWMLLAAQGAAASLFLQGCWPLGEGSRTVLPATFSLADWKDLWIFGFVADSAGRSRLFRVDFREERVRELILPLAGAHQLVSRDCEPRVLHVLGVDSDTACRVNAETMQVEASIPFGEDGYVTSGHGAFLVRNGRELLVTSEYLRAKPENGTICLRDAHDYRVVERFSSRGKYPHVISFRDAERELVVQNLGQPAGREQYAPDAELLLFDWRTLRFKRKVLPGREAHKYDFGPGQGEGDARFRNIARYQLDSKSMLYPKRGTILVEDDEGPSLSIWNAREQRLLRIVRAPGFAPLHAYVGPGSPHVLAANRGGGVAVLPNGGSEGCFFPKWLKEFRTDMHIGPVARTCTNPKGSG